MTADDDSRLHQLIQLMDIMKRDATDRQPIIALHPAQIPQDLIHTNREEYTSKELQDLKQRDFQTRLFISSFCIENCVWMRTHHTDNAERMTNFTYIRDYYKAARTTFNHSSAKAIMTTLLTVMIAKEKSNYCSFATVVASGLSEHAKHTSFEIDNDMVRDKLDLPIARQHLLVLMDIVFQKLSTRSFLLGKNNKDNFDNCNIFRLVHCMTKGRKGLEKMPIIYCIFSFFLQACLTTFIIFQIVADSRVDKRERSQLLTNGLYVLATLGFVYSLLIAVPEVTSTMRALRGFYNGHFGFICIIDLIVNIIITLTLVVAGFIVVINEDLGFINAVLNTAALLFIPQIDDRLPALLGYDENAIVENYLIREAKLEYNKYHKMKDDKLISDKVLKAGLGIQFNDFFITNTIERGRSDQDFALYQPFVVRKDKYGEEMYPSKFITEDCLLKKIEWRYTHWEKGDTTKPRVGYMKIYKLNGESLEIKYDGKESIPIQDKLYSVPDGVYIITRIVLSSSISKLRLCGSNTAEDFQKAMEYYSLWELTFGAKKLLGKHKRGSISYGGSSKRPEVGV